MTVGINTEAINHKNIPFTMYDLGWVVLCIGAAIGSGIVFFPLQVGLKGVWVFALAVILGYPAVYYMQKLFIETMARSDEQDSYLSIITSYVGSRWGVLLGALYSFTMLKSMVEYALAITNDSASYLKTFGLTNQTLSEHWWWSLLLIAGLSLVASKGEKLLFKVSGSMIAVKLVIIVAIGFVVIPFWDVSNIGAFPTVSHLVVGTFPTLPFAIFSIMFVGILNPMNIAYKKREEDKDVAKYKILRVHKVAYLVLVATVLLFVMSIVLSISEASRCYTRHCLHVRGTKFGNVTSPVPAVCLAWCLNRTTQKSLWRSLLIACSISALVFRGAVLKAWPFHLTRVKIVRNITGRTKGTPSVYKSA